MMATYGIFATYHAIEMWDRVGRGGTRSQQIEAALVSFVLPAWEGRAYGRWRGKPLTPGMTIREYMKTVRHHAGKDFNEVLVFQRPATRYLFFSALSVAVVLLCPICTVILAVTLRRAAVKYTHLLRIAAYSCAIIPIATVVWLETIRVVPFQGHDPQVVWIAEVGCLMMPVWLVTWWACALGRYLRLKHAWPSGLAIVILAYLVSCGLLALVVRGVADVL